MSTYVDNFIQLVNAKIGNSPVASQAYVDASATGSGTLFDNLDTLSDPTVSEMVEQLNAILTILKGEP